MAPPSPCLHATRAPRHAFVSTSSVTFLKGEHNSEAVLKSAARAMSHSSKTQASTSYDKEKHDRLVASAKRVCEAYAARFTASQAPKAA